MGLVAAIFGLAVLVMIHEAGHFFAARAVGMTPRKFYIGFGPPIVKTVRGGVEYGIGSIPLGGYVKIPGMNRPSPGDLAASLQPDARERLRAGAGAARRGARAAATTTRPARRSPSCARSSASRGCWQELEWALAPDAYWRQATWRRLVAIAAGPAVNLVFALVLFAVLFMVASTRDTNVIGRVVSGHACRGVLGAARRATRILRVAGVDGDARRRSRRTSARRTAARSGCSSCGTEAASRSGRCARSCPTAPIGSGSRSSRAPARASPSRRPWAIRCG